MRRLISIRPVYWNISSSKLPTLDHPGRSLQKLARLEQLSRIHLHEGERALQRRVAWNARRMKLDHLARLVGLVGLHDVHAAQPHAPARYLHVFRCIDEPLAHDVELMPQRFGARAQVRERAV